MKAREENKYESWQGWWEENEIRARAFVTRGAASYQASLGGIEDEVEDEVR